MEVPHPIAAGNRYVGCCPDAGPDTGAGRLADGGPALRSSARAVSLWLNGGAAVTEVADRAGHSVEILLRVYAKCIDAGEEITNRRVDEALAA